MNKYIGIVIFAFLTIVKIFCIDISIGDADTSISIKDNIMKIDSYRINEVLKEEYNVSWEEINNINFMSFYYNGKFLGENIPHGNKRYLVLSGDNYFIFYNNNQMEYYIRSRPEANVSFDVSASSELIENNIKYSAKNLNEIRSLLPWSEGVLGNGIGQKIKLELKNGLMFGVNGLIISNGFVDYNRPYLYEYNNRVKRIRVSYEGYNETKEFEIKDTPEFQYINIGLNFKPSVIWIEILDIYKGTKYDDTCINNIFLYGF